MVGRIIAGLGALAVAGSFAGAACGEEGSAACAPFPVIVKNLAAKYHEQPVSGGLTAEGKAMMVIFAAEDGATWTAVLLRAQDKVGCIVAAGASWSAIQPKPPGTGL